MSEHRNLTGASLHEPKGCATAAEGSVYTADGAGSGDWTVPSGSTFGALIVAANTSAQAMGAPTDSTLYTDSDYDLIDSGIWSAGESSGVTLNAAGGYIEIVTAGVYEISFWTTYMSDTINTLSAIRFSTDATNTTLSPQRMSRKNSSANQRGVVSASGYASLSAGDKVAVFVATSLACNLTFEDAGLSVVLLKEA